MGSASSVDAVDTTQSWEKQQGDFAVKAGQFHDAVAWYTKCIAIEGPVGSAEPQASCPNEALAKLFSNRSAAYSGMGNFHKALDDGLRAIELHPTWTKGYFRAASAAKHLGDSGLRDGRDLVMKALALSPTDETLQGLQADLFDNFQPHQDGQGTVFSWGRGDEGQLGHGMKKTRQSLPTMLDAFRGKDVVEVAAGAMHSLALTVNGDVYSWGSNGHGQCGLSAEIDQDKSTVAIPRLIPALLGRRVVAIACGAGHSVAVTADGATYTWGIGKQGQLGHGTLSSEPAPRRIESMAANKAVVSVTCGIAHTMLLTTERRLFGCGLNTFGQLGTGSRTEQAVAVPTWIESVSDVSHVACGGAHTCIVDGSGRLWSSGSNSCGQLGLGHADDMFSFELVPMPCRCALVVCGEEFSGAVTATQDVWMWGLGIAGQMGDGTYTSYPSPQKVAGLPPMDTLSVSQAQVFGTTAEGSVWTWGLPGDQAHDAGAVIKLPQQVAAFFGKKRVRQLCCGRKHYVIVTTGAYGPTSTLQLKSCAPFVAGAWVRFVIQSRDVNGLECSTGGSRFSGRLSLVDADDATVALGLVVPDCVVEVDDDMNGSYSGRCRSATAGRFAFGVALHSLSIAGSPFELDIVPGPAFPPQCLVTWEAQATDGQIQVLPNGLLSGTLVLRDKYGNPTTDVDASSVVVVQVTDPAKNSIEFKQSYSIANARIAIQCPQQIGEYVVDIGIDGIFNDCAVCHSPFALTVHAEASPPLDLEHILSKCHVVCPTSATAGTNFVISVAWDDDGIVSRLGGWTVKVVITPATDHTLSPRALVRCGHAQGSVVQTVAVLADKSSVSFGLAIARQYSIAVSLEHTNATTSSQPSYPIDLSASTLQVLPARPHVDFTEIQHAKSQLDQLRRRERVDLVVQLRDAYGNACCSISDAADRVTAFLAPSFHLSFHDSTPVNVDPGAAPGTVQLRVNPSDDSTHLHVLLNDIPIMYSPFAMLDDADAPVLPARPTMVYAPLLAPPVNLVTSLASLEELKRQEVTRRRASDALRRERARVQAERDRQLKQKAMKRTGGGFTVQFEPPA